MILFAEIMQVYVYKNHYTDIKEIIQTIKLRLTKIDIKDFRRRNKQDGI
jgi:hypothetical protein